jgi:TRAP-type mannitol/chloroaromatic compound transport system permease small subunit
MKPQSYVSSRIIISFVIALVVLVIFTGLVTNSLSDEKNRIFNLLRIIVLELPVAGSVAVFVVYTFMLPDNRLSSLSSSSPAGLFVPSVLLTIFVLLAIVALQELVMPTLVKQRFYIEGVKDIIVGFDKRNYLMIGKAQYDSKSKNIILRNVYLVDKSSFSRKEFFAIASYILGTRELILGKKSYKLDGDLEKVLLFYISKENFMSIWEFPVVRDSFTVFEIKPSPINLVLYEKIFMPTIGFIFMLFSITFGWMWRMRKSSVLMPLYIIVGGVALAIIIKVGFYFTVKLFEFLVFTF